ncbi:MAG: ATP-dependent zinc metalloprotease FtsH [Planctomycetota bacterium]
MSDPNPNPNKPSPQGPQPPGRFGRPLMFWVLVIGLALLLVSLYNQGFGDRREITASEFWTHARNTRTTGDIVGTVVVTDTEIRGTFREDLPGLKPDESRKFYVPYEYKTHEGFQEELDKALGNRAKVKYEPAGWWSSILPHLLILGLGLFALWFFLLRRIGSGAGGGAFGNFGRSKHRILNKEHVKVTFEDVAGIEEAKEEVSEIIEFLKNPRRFARIGGRVPRGVLLAGEPGCGKTLLAKAIAGEAEVPFFSISGSDFVEMFVGVGASRVRDLFRQAKESSPCIIFLDEIDAVGRRRTHESPGGGGQETSQTLNAILVEMDGFDSSDQVIVIAATNRPDVLDPALTRPGRFDRQIRVPLPDLKGRLDILTIYMEKVKTGPDVDPERLARGTAMFSGADLEAIVNEAAIAATMAGKDFIDQGDLEEARDKVRWGRSKKSRVIDEKEKESTAYHEAGHAVVQLLTEYSDPLHKVSIIPRGPMGGATFSLPEKDRYFYSRNFCTDFMKVCFAGRIAEEMFVHDVNSGAQNDIAQATEVARKMVLDWGMSPKLGPVNYNKEDNNSHIDLGGKEYSDRTAEIVDDEIRNLIDGAFSAAKDIVEANRQAVQRVAEALMKYETLSADEVQAIVDGKTLDKPTVQDLIAAEHARVGDSQKDAASPGNAEPEPPTAPGLGPAPQPS